MWTNWSSSSAACKDIKLSLKRMAAHRILIIDDSEDVHALLGVLLQGEGLELRAAMDGVEGFAQAKALNPDLILLDIDMPGADGFEVCRQLKADPTLSEIPVVFLSGMTEPAKKFQGLELGAIDFITKPFDPAELRARVRASLRTRELMS